jgi:soluble lytic murein transglycosylase-like protein
VRPRGRVRSRRIASWALGASLAIGGIGAPMRMLNQQQGASAKQGEASSLDQELAGDLASARSIAEGVAHGVEAAVGGVQAVGEAPRQLAIISEKVRENFFRTEVPFGSIIYSEAKKNNLRPELVAAVVEAESRFKPAAKSHAGAVGLMQLKPKTGRWMGARDLTNPVQNITAGTKYLKYLHERFDGNETKVIAAYNAGEGNVKRFGGVPPFRETRNYVEKVRNFEEEYRNRVENRVGDASTADADAFAR